MPVYRYKADDGTILDLTMTIAEKQERENKNGQIEMEGVIFHRDYTPNHRPAIFKPVHSEALGWTHREQIPEAQEYERKHGMYIDYDNNLCPVLRTEKQRKKYARIYGYDM